MALDDDLRIPWEMERLGFKIIQTAEGRGRALLAPILECFLYHPNKEGKYGKGKFKSIEFDENNNTASIETLDGEVATLRVDADNDTVHYWVRADGKEKEKDYTYERNSRVIMWVDRHIRENPVAALMKYDEETSTLTVEKDGGGEVYRQRVQVPEGVKLEVILDGQILKISETKGGEFRIVSDYRSGRPDSQSKHIAIALDPEAIKDGKAKFMYMLDGCSGPVDDIPNLVDGLMSSTFYQELERCVSDSKTATIDVGSKPLTAFGPNRKGEYMLASGKSFIVYNPKTKEFSLAGGWGSQSYIKSTILSGSVEQGPITIREDFSAGVEGGHETYRITINFGNTDPKNSYTAELVETTRPRDG